MLILSRRKGERIHIAPDIVITVTAIDRDRVKIGIDAPKNTPIEREELLRFDDPRRRDEKRPT